jgi:tetratricopeptide (TPR) repeat protein
MGALAGDVASDLLAAAGGAAHAVGAFEAADAQFVRALDAAARSTAGEDVLRRRIALLFRRYDALLPLGRYATLRQVLAELDGLIPDRDDERLRARLGSCFAHVAFIHHNDNAAGIAFASRSLAAAERFGDARLVIATRFYLGQLHYAAGDLERSAVVLARNVELLPLTPATPRFDRFFGIISRSWSAFPLADLGRLDEARGRCDDALAAAESSDEPVGLLAALLGFAHVEWSAGRFAEALRVIDRARGLPEYDVLFQWRAPFDTVRGAVLVALDRANEAHAVLQTIVDEKERIGMMGHHVPALAHLADALHRLGRHAQARRAIAAALDRARERGERGFGALALRIADRIGRPGIERGRRSEIDGGAGAAAGGAGDGR